MRTSFARIGLLAVMVELGRDEGVSFLDLTHETVRVRYASDGQMVAQAVHIVESGLTKMVFANSKYISLDSIVPVRW